MRLSIGGVLGIIGGLVPLVYIGWLLRHFIGVGGGTAQGVGMIGLGPTVMGLMIVGLVLALPLIIKLLRAVTGTGRVPGSHAGKVGEFSVETEGFDADAAFSNYMRNRDAAPPPPIAPDALEGDLRPFTPRPGGFGRKSS